MAVKPYSTDNDPGGKKMEVEQMFNTIAPTYDLLNRLLSFRMDIWWRYVLAQKVKVLNPRRILDVATGTGDVAIKLAAVTQADFEAVDIAADMLSIGRQKALKAGLQKRINFSVGDAEHLNFDTGSFDVVTAAFGVRNFEDLQKGLTDMARVLKPEGTCLILEFSMPQLFPFKQLYYFYFKNILPAIGRFIASDPKAYMYLFKSVEAFPKGNAFVKEMEKAGFKNVKQYPLSLGVVCLYTGQK